MSALRKRKREDAGDIDRQLVKIYDDLADERETTRFEAAKALLTKLTHGASVRREVLERLFRGLASGRKSARVGFSVALTELLRLYARPEGSREEQGEIAVDEAIELLQSSTRISNDVKGQESRDHYLGKLFGAAAIIRSQVLFIGGTERWERVLDFILGIAKKKVWLREECGWLMYETVQNAESLGIVDDKLYVQSLIDRLQASGLVKTLEGVSIWMAVRQKYPSIVLPQGVFAHNSPLSKEEQGNLARILRQTSLATAEQDEAKVANKSTGAWFSKLHFGWEIVLQAALQDDKEQASFAELWQEAVDGAYFTDVKLWLTNGRELIL